MASALKKLFSVSLGAALPAIRGRRWPAGARHAHARERARGRWRPAAQPRPRSHNAWLAPLCTQGRPNFQNPIFGESLYELCRKATTRQIDQPDEILNQQVGSQACVLERRCSSTACAAGSCAQLHRSRQAATHTVLQGSWEPALIPAAPPARSCT